MRRRGAEGVSFAPIVAAGEHGARPHAVPRDVPIPAGTLVVIDWGAQLDGYASDCTRTVATGELDPRDEAIYETVLVAQEAALRAVRAGPDRQGGRRRRARDHRRRRPRRALRPRPRPRRRDGGPRGPAPGQDRRGPARGRQHRDRRAGHLRAGRGRRADRGPRRGHRRRVRGAQRAAQGAARRSSSGARAFKRAPRALPMRVGVRARDEQRVAVVGRRAGGRRRS